MPPRRVASRCLVHGGKKARSILSTLTRHSWLNHWRSGKFSFNSLCFTPISPSPTVPGIDVVTRVSLNLLTFVFRRIDSHVILTEASLKREPSYSASITIFSNPLFFHEGHVLKFTVYLRGLNVTQSWEVFHSNSSNSGMFVYMSNLCLRLDREPLLEKLLVGWLPSHLSTSDLPIYKYKYRFEWTRCP